MSVKNSESQTISSKQGRSQKWLAYVAAGAATTATICATHGEACGQIVVRDHGVGLFPADVVAGGLIGTTAPGSRARFSTSLSGNGDIAISAIHPAGFGFGRVFGQAANGARFFGEQETFPFTTFSGGQSVDRINFPANAALGARFSTLQTQLTLRSGRSFMTNYGDNDHASILADPLGAEARQFHQFGQTYLPVSPAIQQAHLAFTFDDAAGQTQYGWVRLNLETPGLQAPQPPGAANQFGLNGITVDQVAFTTAGQADLDRGFAVGVVGVPEPGSLTMLALGAVGVATWRRKRRTEVEG